MKTAKQATGTDLTRRDALKLSGLALGGLAVDGTMVGAGAPPASAAERCGRNGCGYPNTLPTRQYTYPTQLDPFTPNTPFDPDELRITFLVSGFPPARRAQQMMSIFVEVGPWIPDPNGGPGHATDAFVFDCGAGALTNYTAMGGTTPMSAGIPKAIQDLTVRFQYNDIDSVKSLFQQYPHKIACVILEPEKEQEPKNNFLSELKKICHENGAIFILDEMITGFRWHNGGAQRFYDITPDLSSFGKAMANGFSVAALVGKKEIMQLGGLKHDGERVFLMSGTHGAENHGLAAALETMKIYEKEPVIETLCRQGEQLASKLRKSINENRLTDYIPIMGRPCCLVYGTRDNEKKPSQPFRTLLIQETMKRGILAPSLVISYSHTVADI